MAIEDRGSRKGTMDVARADIVHNWFLSQIVAHA